MLKKLLLCLMITFVFITTSSAKPRMFKVFIAHHYTTPQSTVYEIDIESQMSQTYPYGGVSVSNGARILSKTQQRIKNENWAQVAFRPHKIERVIIEVLTPYTHLNLKLKLALNILGSSPITSTEYTFDLPNETSSDPGRIIGYIYGWETPPSATDLAAAGYTHVLLTFGLFSTTAPGTINIDALSGFDIANYVQELHAQGVKVLLSLGGASTSIPNTTVNFDQAVSLATSPQTFINTFVSAMAQLANQYGFDGFDFDIESGLNAATSFSNPSEGCDLNTYTSSCDIAYLSTIINTFHEQYPAPYLTLVPQIANIAATSAFSATWGNYASLIMQVAPALEWVAFQNYNSGCAFGIDLICYPTTGSLTSTADPAVAFSTDLLANWPATTASGQITGFLPYISLLNPSQVVIGYVVSNAQGQTDGDPSVNPYFNVVKNAIQCLRTNQQCDTYTPPNTYPNIGGVFAWSINYDATLNYPFATTLYPCVVGGNCID